MELADRMLRLSTESAFEVLAKARALEATGVDVVHWIGRVATELRGTRPAPHQAGTATALRSSGLAVG
jgi:hypothetical protein